MFVNVVLLCSNVCLCVNNNKGLFSWIFLALLTVFDVLSNFWQNLTYHDGICLLWRWLVYDFKSRKLSQNIFVDKERMNLKWFLHQKTLLFMIIFWCIFYRLLAYIQIYLLYEFFKSGLKIMGQRLIKNNAKKMYKQTKNIVCQ